MYKLYSQRKQEEINGSSDVYIYETFCQEFRNQYLYIVRDIFNFGNEEFYSAGSRNINFWRITCEGFSREKGLKALSGYNYGDINNAKAYELFVDLSNDKDFLDLMDYTFTVIISSSPFAKIKGKEKINSAIKELNYRFKQHSLGYEFINGKLIEKNNEQIHREIIKPALYLLHNRVFQGAEQEYFQAFDCFKEKNNKDAILNAIKAFESVLKIICKEMGYQYDNDKDSVKKLLQHLSDNKFYPEYLESHLAGIRTTLESGAPTLRNKSAGHGQGAEVIDVTDEYVEYALNLVATNIVFLVKLFNRIKGNKNESKS